jgi:ABC-type Fe3+/spermidine/putrescine transport system ATPase subunit
VYIRPKTRFVAGFLGAVNWIGPIGVRPESTRLSRQPDGPRGVVTGASFLGDSVEIFVKLESGEDVVIQTPRECAQYQTGDTVYLQWNAADEMRL